MNDKYSFITMPRACGNGLRQIIETIKAVQKGNRVRVVRKNGETKVYDKQNVCELYAMLGLNEAERKAIDSTKSNKNKKST